MKKVIIMFVILFSISISSWAETYKVTKLSDIGILSKKTDSGLVQIASEGEILDGEIQISIGLSCTAEIVRQSDGKKIIIAALRNDILDRLFNLSGIKIGGKVVTSNTSTNNNKITNVGTASTRASDAAADTEWQE